ncbi:I78 family peptidase inhibitor [Vreelandella sulfidaeris]|uniref:I78 family peptidase inhibitor n=1 Tax=Vreelandella sulfidaeris TaxID=115553 RepID=UPI0035ED4AAF
MKSSMTLAKLSLTTVGTMMLTACVSAQMPMSPATDDVDAAPPPPNVEANNPRAEGAVECDIAAIQYAVGESFEETSEAKLQRESDARHVRVLHPGDVATMDYRSDRLNIHLNDQEVIEELRCG